MSRRAPPPLPARAEPAAVVLAAAQGRVEGKDEAIEVGAGVSGVVRRFSVREGQFIHKDDVVAELDCENLDAEIQSWTENTASLKAVKARLIRGSRPEERSMVRQRVNAAIAVHDQAQTRYSRLAPLLSTGDISKDAVDQAKRDVATAKAAVEAARDQERLVTADPLPEELAKAEADIASAKAHRRKAELERAKCTIRTPITGTVLQVFMRPGETYSVLAGEPLISIANLSEKRVRAEVEERDLARTFVGQKVLVLPEGFNNQLQGEVQWLSPKMGRKKTRSPDPAERTDRDVREVIVSLGSQASTLPVGLRVVVEFQGSPN